MAVSKRVRFEVLRRDGFRCTYCGLTAPETGAGLTIDHVIPSALGGTDAPTNLVAACRDCNSGKSSAMPDDSMVADSIDAETQRLAVEQRRATVRADMEQMKVVTDAFLTVWDGWKMADGDKVPLPLDWRSAVYGMWQAGASQELFDYAVPIAMGRSNFRHGEYAEFRYCLGVVKNQLGTADLDYAITPSTARTFTQNDRDEFGAYRYCLGYDAGRGAAMRFIELPVFAAMFIDGRTELPLWKSLAGPIEGRL